MLLSFIYYILPVIMSVSKWLFTNEAHKMVLEYNTIRDAYLVIEIPICLNERVIQYRLVTSSTYLRVFQIAAINTEWFILRMVNFN